ncbi:hypothetical protein J2Z78_005176 [Streptomyces griseorubens]
MLQLTLLVGLAVVRPCRPDLWPCAGEDETPPPIRGEVTLIGDEHGHLLGPHRRVVDAGEKRDQVDTARAMRADGVQKGSCLRRRDDAPHVQFLHCLEGLPVDAVKCVARQQLLFYSQAQAVAQHRAAAPECVGGGRLAVLPSGQVLLHRAHALHAVKVDHGRRIALHPCQRFGLRLWRFLVMASRVESPLVERPAQEVFRRAALPRGTDRHSWRWSGSSRCSRGASLLPSATYGRRERGRGRTSSCGSARAPRRRSGRFPCRAARPCASR